LCTTRCIGGCADLGLEYSAPIRALEQEQIGAAHEQPLGTEVEKSAGRAPGEVKAAAVRRVDPNGAPLGHEPRIGTPLGAMTVNDIGSRFRSSPCDMRARGKVPQPELPAHFDTRESEREIRRQPLKTGLGHLAAGGRVRHETHPVPARDLPVREVEHVPKQPANRGAHHMQDVQEAFQCSTTRASRTRFSSRFCYSPSESAVLNPPSTIIVWNWLTSRTSCALGL
jgi:hypothetical protein